MEIEDLSKNSRIAGLTKLMQALEQSTTPVDTLQTIRRGLNEVYGPTATMMLSTRGLGPGEYRLIQLQLENRDPPKDLNQWYRGEFPIYRGGLVEKIISNPGPQIIHDADWTSDPNFRDRLGEYGSLVAVPLVGKRLPMNWAILMKRKPERFTPAELEEIMLRSMLIGSLLESQTLAQDLAVAHDKIDHDLQQVAELQRSLLPCPLPEICGLEIAVSYEPSGRAGGDLYDFFPLQNNGDAADRWCIFIADASGHGPAAAVVMAIVQSLLRAHPRKIWGPADLLKYANHHLSAKKIAGFVTAFLGIYEPVTRRMIYTSAGHPAPLLKTSSTGGLSLLDAATTYPIGIDESEAFKEATVQLNPGDTILLYTDGITEARGKDLSMLESERLDREFLAHEGSPETLIKLLQDVVHTHQQGQKPVDDQTLVVLRSV